MNVNRLTGRINGEAYVKRYGGLTSICYGCDRVGTCKKKKCGFYHAIEKLAAYEDVGLEPEHIDSVVEQLLGYLDAEEMEKYELEQGLLIKLPCKVGSIVWCIDDTDEDLPWCIEFDYWMIPGMGKTVFLTREEAEKALEASNGE